jgi:hypothetical protein
MLDVDVRACTFHVEPRGNSVGGYSVSGTRYSVLLVALVSLATVAFASVARAEIPKIAPSGVGVPVSMDQLVLPGGEVEPIPVTDKTPVIVRIDRVFPHGSAFRYDLVYYGLEPGEFDLSQFLKRKDGSSAADLPAVPIQITSVLPPGQVEPSSLTFGTLPWLGGYRGLMILVSVLWIAGLIWLLWPKRKRAAARQIESGPATISLADRLRPLVSDAMAGRLPPERLAELERALIVCWRRRLGLTEAAPAEALAKLRQHPEASPLMNQLEIWLHRPPGGEAVDINALLKPYQNIAADEMGPVEASLRPAASTTT